jgi:hypothetical protein
MSVQQRRKSRLGLTQQPLEIVTQALHDIRVSAVIILPDLSLAIHQHQPGAVLQVEPSFSVCGI